MRWRLWASSFGGTAWYVPCNWAKRSARRLAGRSILPNSKTLSFLCRRLRHHGLAPGLERDDRKQRRQDVGAGRDDEDLVPASRGLLHIICDGNQKRCRSLGGVEQTRIGGREFRAERVGAGRREQRIDLTPGE